MAESPAPLNQLGTYCSSCAQVPNDILVLTCQHNLCLSCASNNLQRQNSKQIHSFDTIVCDLCGAQTVLQPAAASHLSEIINKERMELFKEAEQTLEHLGSFTRPPMHRSQVIHKICPLHPHETLRHVCFTCNLSLLCAECVIDSSHRYHQTMPLRKALPLIQNNMDEFILSGNAKLQTLDGDRKKMRNYVNQIEKQAAFAINEVSRDMAQLRRRIDIKEREIFVEIENAKEELLHRVRQLLHLLSTKLEDSRRELIEVENISSNGSHAKLFELLMNPNFEKLKGKLMELENWRQGFSQEFQPFISGQDAHKHFQDLGGHNHSLQVVKQIMVQLDFLKAKKDRQREEWVRADDSFLESSPQKQNLSAMNEKLESVFKMSPPQKYSFPTNLGTRLIESAKLPPQYMKEETQFDLQATERPQPSRGDHSFSLSGKGEMMSYTSGKSAYNTTLNPMQNLNYDTPALRNHSKNPKSVFEMSQLKRKALTTPQSRLNRLETLRNTPAYRKYLDQ